MIFRGFFWAYILSGAWMQFSKSPDIQGRFWMASLPQLSVLGFRWLTVRLTDVPGSCGVLVPLQCFWTQGFCAPSSEYGKTDKHLASILYPTPHRSGQMVIFELRTSLLPLEPGAMTYIHSSVFPTLGTEAAPFNCYWARECLGQGQVKHHTAFLPLLSSLFLIYHLPGCCKPLF